MVVVVVVVVGGVVRTGGAGLNRYLVVVSGAFSKSFEGGPSTCLRSTQHRMVWEGHEISSRTSSQSKEANAWRHFPGHSLTSAVLVMEPSKPGNISFCHCLLYLLLQCLSNCLVCIIDSHFYRF